MSVQFCVLGATSFTAAAMRSENSFQSLSLCAGQVRNFTRSSERRCPDGRPVKRSSAFMASALVTPGWRSRYRISCALKNAATTDLGALLSPDS